MTDLDNIFKEYEIRFFKGRWTEKPLGLIFLCIKFPNEDLDTTELGYKNKIQKILMFCLRNFNNNSLQKSNYEGFWLLIFTDVGSFWIFKIFNSPIYFHAFQRSAES